MNVAPGAPGVRISDPRTLLVAHLDWYRTALTRKLAGLSESQLRERVAPLTWSPIGLVQHLGWVERRWIRWGFAAEDVQAYPPGGDATEWAVGPDDNIADVMAAYQAEVARSRALTADASLDERARVGGRFTTPEQAPALAWVLFHLLQEYARHVGQLDVARELIDGVVGE
uniref:DinB family protein n=1 Tax=Streptomyces sp. NBC_00008 TaxID=2903610 RepID=A0AAU2W2G3_9ACTN